METARANPDEILRAIQLEEKKEQTGNLKIFFGYAAGVGKTYAMLKAAQNAKQHGIDVVIGYVEPHSRPQTQALVNGLEQISLQHISSDGINVNEFDVAAALRRKPQLILVDELAHTNAPGSRHKKRYQDVEELLRAGIDVYTTINVQHIESLCDIVTSITGITVRERIPDDVFDEAAQVKLVDIEPQELIDRLNEGKIYHAEQAKRALDHFFSLQNLTALREIALRRCADRVNRVAESGKIQTGANYYTDEHVLVCLSSSPTNAKIIRTAARMAQAFHGRLTALFVETPDFSSMSDANKARLRDNTHLAQQLGATIETSYGEDVAFQIAEFARFSGVSKIVVGRFNARHHGLFSKQPLTEKLTEYAPGLDVYIIPDLSSHEFYAGNPRVKSQFIISDLFKCMGMLFSATAIGLLFYYFGLGESNIITVYILGVLITAIVTGGQFYSIAYSIVSVLVFNFFFTEPRFTLNVYNPEYLITFLIMFIAGLITSNLALRIKHQAKQSAQSASRTRVLFDTNQSLQKAANRSEIIAVTANELQRLLQRDIVFYPSQNGILENPMFYSAQGNQDPAIYLTENEKAVATWVFHNNKRAGAATDTLSSAQCMYLAVRIESHVYAVIGIVMKGSNFDPFENSILLSILGECAMALQNEQTRTEKEQAAILAKNEQLRANLLRAISHDLRTPLTSISGNSGILISSGELIPEDKKKKLYTDIYDDSLWLINLVENLLAVTRIEDGSIGLRLKPELMDEVIAEALRHISRKKAEHHVILQQEDSFILARMDARLIVQVIINIVDNAVKYTPSGSTITISTYPKGKMLVTEISDDGPGISDDEKPRIFDMFYTATPKIIDSRRSMGLGLALCKSVITAHKGTITVLDNKPKGTVFRFTLPIEEVALHE